MYYVYFVRAATNPPLIKIGVSNRPHHRLCLLQVGSPVALEILFTWSVGTQENAFATEALLHDEYRALHRRGEWFELSNDDLDDLAPDEDEQQMVDSFAPRDARPRGNTRLARILRADPDGFDNARFVYRKAED